MSFATYTAWFSCFHASVSALPLDQGTHGRSLEDNQPAERDAVPDQLRARDGRTEEDDRARDEEDVLDDACVRRRQLVAGLAGPPSSLRSARMGRGGRREERGDREDVPDSVSTSELAHPMRNTTATFSSSATFALINNVNGPTRSMTTSNGAQPSKMGIRRAFRTKQTCERG